MESTRSTFSKDFLYLKDLCFRNKNINQDDEKSQAEFMPNLYVGYSYDCRSDLTRIIVRSESEYLGIGDFVVATYSGCYMPIKGYTFLDSDLWDNQLQNGYRNLGFQVYANNSNLFIARGQWIYGSQSYCIGIDVARVGFNNLKAETKLTIDNCVSFWNKNSTDPSNDYLVYRVKKLDGIYGFQLDKCNLMKIAKNVPEPVDDRNSVVLKKTSKQELKQESKPTDLPAKYRLIVQIVDDDRVQITGYNHPNDYECTVSMKSVHLTCNSKEFCAIMESLIFNMPFPGYSYEVVPEGNQLKMIFRTICGEKIFLMNRIVTNKQLREAQKKAIDLVNNDHLLDYENRMKTLVELSSIAIGPKLDADNESRIHDMEIVEKVLRTYQ